MIKMSGRHRDEPRYPEDVIPSLEGFVLKIKSRDRWDANYLLGSSRYREMSVARPSLVHGARRLSEVWVEGEASRHADALATAMNPLFSE